VQGLEPDFILYSQQNGLIILEVKDWNLSQIREVNPHHFVLDIGGKTEERFSPRFAFRLSGPEMDHLKQLIFPAVRVEIPERGSERPYKKRICRLRGLDHHQEALARKFENGHRIIIGPSGCGKTLILVHKADCLFRYNSKIKSILFICYNITLANYIRRLLAENGVPFGRNGVQVKHFYELCSEIIGEPVEYENEDSDYFDFHGPEPELKELKDLDAVVAFTADKIGQVVKAEGCPYSEIAVIYTLKRPDPDRESLPILLENTLASRGILSRWAAENYRSKRTYDITTNSVTISTIHSVKGLDFSCVFLIGLDYLELKEWTEEQVNNLVYVGLTRARYQLYIPFINKTPLINRLQGCIN